MRQVLILIVFLVLTQNIFSQEQSDTLGVGGINWFAYPYAFYSPETNLAFGAGGIVSTKLAEETKSSSATLSGYYSINNQFDITLQPEIYFTKNSYKLWAKINYGEIFDYFYGIGNQTANVDNDQYLQGNFLTQIKFQPKLFDDRLNLGFSYEFRHLNILDRKDNPNLDNKNLIGINGGTTSGLGIVASWDSRDNIFYPHTGGYYEFNATSFQKCFGSDFTYTKYVLDMRRFFPAFSDHTFGLQSYFMQVTAAPPFYDLALMGGDRVMRGYLYGRYRDKFYYAFQGEYRVPNLIWKFGFTAFAGFGDVATKISKIEIHNVKPTYGFGVRFRFDELQKLDLRADFGFGKGTSGIYFSVNQAF
jgi:hypothetical protein